MGGNAQAAATTGEVLDPAEDWSGIESDATRARRRAELWPQLFSTGIRGLFIVWGVAMSMQLVLAGWVGVPILFSSDRARLGLWGASLLLSIGGAWLAFRIAADMDVEMEDAPGEGPS